MKFYFISALILISFIFVGWIKNVIKISEMGLDSDQLAELVLRTIGCAVIPIGAIMGYFVA